MGRRITAREEASPFHAGERAVQEQLGVRESIEAFARRVVRPYLPDEHRAFYAGLPFLVVAARDAEERPWATLLAGRPGFASSPGPRTLEIDAGPGDGDALVAAFGVGADVGILGIEPHTRRRNRVNGQVLASGEDRGFALEVGQAFGNCPQFIYPRRWREAPRDAVPSVERFGATLPAEARSMIESANTFFIATGHPLEGRREGKGDAQNAAFGMDASHRGGPAGFVAFDEADSLMFPDYAGNNHFNTLGNLTLDARAGLTFVDFTCGHLLQLTGRAEIDWQQPDPDTYPGAQRLVRFEIEAAVLQRDVLPLRFEEPEAAVRVLHVAEKVRESDDVVSFVLEAEDGAVLPPWLPGQHLPISMEMGREVVDRTYSLSNAPDAGRYRISVKRETHGLASRFLHDEVAVGHALRTRPPAGDFALEVKAAERPIVLIAAGIGVTPLLSMLAGLVANGFELPVTFVLGVRDGAHAALERELQALVERASNAALHVVVSRPGSRDLDAPHRRQGRVDSALLAELVPDREAECYICGPTAFMGDVGTALEGCGVPSERIHTESFGGGAPRAH